jgi:methionyl-tRNA synthetase
MPEQKDSEFTWKSFQEANDNELVANLANFSNRVFVLMHKYFKGKVPKVDEDTEIVGSYGPMMPSFIDAELMELFDKVYELCNCIWEYDFRGAQNWLMQISTWGNQILQANQPWKNHEENPEATKVVLNLCVQTLAALSVAMRPFMPFASDRLRAQLQLPAIKDHRDLVELQNKLAGGKYLVKSGHVIGEPFHLFSRIPDEVIQQQISRLHAHDKQIQSESTSNANGMITFDEFSKCDIRTAKILKAEKVEKADKLLKLEVKIGDEVRTIVSGIALYHNPEDIIGKEVCILANLEPRKIRGIESKGMILMAEDADGKLAFVSPPSGWSDGCSVK